jgi:hypothetical protein
MRIAMSKSKIRIGCTEIELEAAKKILQWHYERFGTENFQDIQ